MACSTYGHNISSHLIFSDLFPTFHQRGICQLQNQRSRVLNNQFYHLLVRLQRLKSIEDKKKETTKVGQYHNFRLSHWYYSDYSQSQFTLLQQPVITQSAVTQVNTSILFANFVSTLVLLHLPVSMLTLVSTQTSAPISTLDAHHPSVHQHHLSSWLLLHP